MARADLHYALVLDREIYEASQVDPDLMDPVVRLEGGLPGPAKPVAVLRRYQGPQGYYREHVTLTDPDGQEIYRSPIRRISLSGEFSEDLFRTHVHDLIFSDPGEHTAHFFVDGEEAGSVPVFIEAGQGGSLSTFVQETFGAALKKGDILWVTVPGKADRRTGVQTFRDIIKGRHESPQTTRSQAVWIVWENGTVYVLSGSPDSDEQHVPGLSEADKVEVTVRSKDVRSAVAQAEADVRRVPRGSDEWEEIAKKMLASRLNLADEDEALSRWREKCDIFALTPRFGAAEQPQAEMAAPAAATPGSGADAESGGGGGSCGESAEPKLENIQVDQEVYDQLISEGKSERVAVAKAKAAWARKEKARLKEEQGAGA
jgi:hypothetical protein